MRRTARENRGNIVIIGAGNVGISLFCDFAVRLHDGSERTRLLYVRDEPTGRWASDTDIIFNDLFQGTSHQVTTKASQCARIGSPTAVEWLESADSIIVTVPDIPYVRPPIFDHLLESVDLSGKMLVLCRAGQGGTPFVAGLIRADRRLHDTDTVMIEDAFYGTRFLKGEVDCKRKYTVNVAVVSRNRERALRRMEAIFPPGPDSPLPSWPHFEAQPLVSLLFDPLGYIIHVGVALSDRNIERTRRGEVYTHYIDGIDRELAAKLARLDAERVAIARAYGVESPTFPQTISRQYQKPVLSSFYEMMQSCRDIYRSQSAVNLDELVNSRYVGEDVPALFTMLRLAEIAGCPVPATRAHLEDVRTKLRHFTIDETPLTTYADAIPRDATVSSLVDLLSCPISGTSPVERAVSVTHPGSRP